MSRDRKLLESIEIAHTEFFELEERRRVFERFLEFFLSLTKSQYGFIAEIRHTGDGKPYLKTFAITNIAWNEETRRFYEENVSQGMEFRNLETLFGQVMVTEESVISNRPAVDPRRGGLPEGHPALNSFLGLPIRSIGSMVGMVGLANRPNGYDRELVDFLDPLLLTCGSFIRTIRNDAEKVEVSDALKDSEARVKAILDSTHDAIITIDDNGTIETVNPATESLFGYTRKELVGKNVKILMPEPNRSRHDDYLRRYLETGEAKVIGIGRETVGSRKDGSRFPLDLAVTQLRVTGRHLFTGIVRDISERKKAQAKAEETFAYLETSNENMLAILNEMSEGVILLDKQGKVNFVNRSIESMLQKSRELLIGEPWSRVFPLPADQKRELRAQLEAESNPSSPLSTRLSLEGRKDIWTDLVVRNDPRGSSGRILFLYDTTEVHSLRTHLNIASTRQMIGTSKVMQEMFKVFDKVAPGDWTVLIEGETGVGKELVARGIHAGSRRRDGPFIAVNCGGLTDSLLTSQLFGHRRGAFTGAVANQQGLFEAANGGTIFLDEIGEIPLELQAGLLRVIEEREITRVGETRPRRIDVRILTATNRILAEEIVAGRFREDLLYRIRVARICVPPLRQRREDIPMLVELFLAEAQTSVQKRIQGISTDAMNLLMEYSWPGNVRELRNVVEMAIIHSTASLIQCADVPFELRERPQISVEDDTSLENPLSSLRAALVRAGGNRTRAAQLMGISRATLYRRLKEAGIESKQRTSPDPRII